VVGEPAEEIARFAEWDQSELIVLLSPGLAGLARPILQADFSAITSMTLFEASTQSCFPI
jgi:nucleotide-binding universal stress UspA family protein